MKKHPYHKIRIPKKMYWITKLYMKRHAYSLEICALFGQAGDRDFNIPWKNLEKKMITKYKIF